MKKPQLLFSLFGIFVVLNGWADSVCHSKHGILRCGIGTVQTIDYNGYANLEGTTVSGMLRVEGNADIHNAQLHQMFGRGLMHLTKTTIADTLEVVGTVEANEVELLGPNKIVGDFYGNHVTLATTAKMIGTVDCQFCIFKNDVWLVGDITVAHSEFLGAITLNAKTSIFSYTKMHNILVKKSSDNEEQVIQLQEGSSVHDIIFESQTGKVMLSKHAQLTGTVQGGKIITLPN